MHPVSIEVLQMVNRWTPTHESCTPGVIAHGAVIDEKGEEFRTSVAAVVYQVVRVDLLHRKSDREEMPGGTDFSVLRLAN